MSPTAMKLDLCSRSKGMSRTLPSRSYTSPPASLRIMVLAAMSTILMALVYFSDFIRNPSASPSPTMAISSEAQPREREDLTRFASAKAS